METTLIWNKFSKSLKGFLISKVKDKNIANDLLQEVFIKIHLNIDSLQNQKSLKSWIFTITSNVINDYYKKSKNLNSELLEHISSSEEIYEQHSAKDCIIPLIKNLPQTYKEAIFLSEIKGIKQAEIANQLNLSLSGAKSRIQRGRELLKKGFISCCDYKLNEYGHLVGEHKDIKDCNICTPE